MRPFHFRDSRQMAKLSIPSSDATNCAFDSLAAVVSTDPLKSARVRSMSLDDEMVAAATKNPIPHLSHRHTGGNRISHIFCSAPEN